MRIFINNVDSYVGKALCADLRSVLGQENRIFGTLQAEGEEASADLVKNLGLKRAVSKADNAKYLEDVLSCSLIIFDLHSSTADEVEAIIKHIKLAKLSHETTFVLISSVNVWAKTLRPDQLAGYEPAKSADEEDQADEEQENNAALDAELKSALAVLPNGELRLPSGATGRFKEQHRPKVLTDKDRDRRMPAPEYEHWKYLETLALSLGPKEQQLLARFTELVGEYRERRDSGDSAAAAAEKKASSSPVQGLLGGIDAVRRDGKNWLEQNRETVAWTMAGAVAVVAATAAAAARHTSVAVSAAATATTAGASDRERDERMNVWVN